MPDRSTPSDDDLTAAGRRLADELKRQVRAEIPLRRALWDAAMTPPPSGPLYLAS